MARISNSQILVAESRRSSELGEMAKSEEGVHIYLVDANIKSNDGAMKPIFERQSNRDRFLIGTSREGESVTTSGMKIEVLRSDSTGEIVRISTKK